MSSFLSGPLPGNPFHPTDEELVAQYLWTSLYNRKHHRVIGDLDVYMYEPWELPNLSKISNSDHELFFFTPTYGRYINNRKRSRKTKAGYWKSKETDKEIKTKTSNGTIGFRKTLAFYEDRAPSGVRLDWQMHEYRLQTPNNSNVDQHNYMLCKIFKKCQRQQQPSVDRRDDTLQSVPAYVSAENSCTREESDGNEVTPSFSVHHEQVVSESYLPAPLSLLEPVSKNSNSLAAPFLSQATVSSGNVSDTFCSTAEAVTYVQGEDKWVDDWEQLMSVIPASLVMSATSPEIREQDIDTTFPIWTDFQGPQRDFTADCLKEVSDNFSSMVGRNPSSWAIENYLPGLVAYSSESSPGLDSVVKETAVKIRSTPTPLNPQDLWESTSMAPQVSWEFSPQFTANYGIRYQKNSPVQTSTLPRPAGAAAEQSSGTLHRADFKASTELPAGIWSMPVNVMTIPSTSSVVVVNQPELQDTICNSTVPQGYRAEESTANHHFQWPGNMPFW